MSSSGVTVLLCLLAVGATAALHTQFRYNPVYFPGKCNPIPPSTNFTEGQILQSWKITHYSNPSFLGYKCPRLELASNADGVEVNVRLLMANNHTVEWKNTANRTDTPGVYAFSYRLPQRPETVISGTEMYYVEGDYAIAWVCSDHPTRIRHEECVFLLSPTSTIPEAVVKKFIRYLKQHGAKVLLFFVAPQISC